jgi:ATP-dependent exoDNAse (exonuclease V) alpha subunit
VHKSQGATVDRTYVLASRYFDRHTSYVALSRHREAATLFYGQDEFAAPSSQGAAPDIAEARRQFEYTLARARPKELAHDYLEPGVDAGKQEDTRHNSPADVQARARKAWMASRAEQGQMSAEEVQDQACERWRAYRQTFERTSGQENGQKTSAASHKRTHSQDDGQGL